MTSIWPGRTQRFLLLEVSVDLRVGTVSTGVTDLDIPCDPSTDPQHRVAHPMQQVVDLMVEVDCVPVQDENEGLAGVRGRPESPVEVFQHVR